MKLACNVARQHLLSFGTCFGRFSKTGKFRLHVTALEFLAPYAKVSDQTSISILTYRVLASYLLVCHVST